MRWSKAGLMEPTSIFDAATLQFAIQVVCACGHQSRFEAHCLWWHFKRRGWDDRLIPARQRFWCRVCKAKLRRKVRPVRLETVRRGDGDFELEWPDEREWKAAVRRVR